ncbi:MAG: L-serine ammonia-lyase [Planctomycetota bacterium]|nr:L-serine ammonia-lyase [Planctomycetota bacterium]
MNSIFELFKIGIGPSSSHTVGPMIAAFRFSKECMERSCVAPGTDVSIARVEVQLYGSLALTGVGHATDNAIVVGLAGCLPDRTSPEVIQSTVDAARKSGRLLLNGQLDIQFDESKDLVWLRNETLPQHPNAIQFKAFRDSGECFLEDQYFSTGGGFVYSREEFDRNFAKSSSDLVVGDSVPYPFRNAKELLQMCRGASASIESLIQANELTLRSELEIDSQLDLLWSVMSNCIDRGCMSSGILPGSLKVPRRAPGIFGKLSQQSALSELAELAVSKDMLPSKLLTESKPGTLTQSDPLAQLDWVSLFALAVNEENAAGGRVVTAPTNGAAGIIPAVLAYYVYFYPGASRQGIHRFLKTAGAIGLLYKRNASLSAAEMGCQGEVGVACSMAAGGLAACMGGSNEQIENAAEIGMEHNLGLTCDPIAGLVQVPCIERNTMGAAKAINAARLAVLYGDGHHFVSLDRVIETMRQTGVDMQLKYKETSLGGLAVNFVDC